MRNDALHALFDANLALPAEYAEGLTNHLPMALHALARLGAGKPRLQAFHATYAARFGETRHSAGTQALDDWQAHRGRYESLPALQATFIDALRIDNAATVLRRVLPDLMPGVSAGAFHGLLRTAHAFEAGHRGELAHGLAYWAARWLPLEAPASAAAPLAFDDWAVQLSAQAAGWSSQAGLIFDRMQAAQSSVPYRALAGRLAPTPETFVRLAAFAADAYAETGNFTVLHMVTGCRAARVLLPFIADTSVALDALIRAFTAAYLASGAARSAPRPAPPRMTWPDITSAAIASDDEHVIKLVDACIDEAAVHGEGRYLRAAARAVG